MKVNDDYCHECGGPLLVVSPYSRMTYDGLGWCKFCSDHGQVEWINLAEARCHRYLNLGDQSLRQRFGEMTAQEIRTVRAVLANILEIDVP